MRRKKLSYQQLLIKNRESIKKDISLQDKIEEKVLTKIVNASK
ncbi:FbpB family small basic protein [Alkalihalobacterium alkalinitrilicum]|nr:FbpB family small basic protein [Alkalihalobacterium alkalinitrilicum]